ELGGLYVLGTERHEARRIDNQLRGRSGRQGDPCETRFYLSGRDDLVRLFAGDRIHNIMERFKLPDDQPMEAGILSRQIENAQKKVEEQNFVARKNVLKYDDVMNVQRQVIYEQRNRVLDGADLSEDIREAWRAEAIQEGLMRDLERFIVLQTVDVRWREHLENMDYLREGIGLRGLAHKDPLVEYRNEGHVMFAELNRSIREEVVALLYHAEVTAA